jgi:putative Mg2+ transporter-C (MgtC) family protein
MDPLIASLHPFVEPIGRLMLAALLGSLLGLEREWHNRTAGLRTNTLIALGSAVYTLLSIQMVGPGGDATRIPSTIVNGVGFLGGGAILRTRGSIHGLTTAATIWVNAAIGMTAGAGHFVLAISATFTALLVLTVLKRVEVRMDRYRPPIPRDGVDPTSSTPPDRRDPPADA